MYSLRKIMKDRKCKVCKDDLNPYSICGGCDNRAYKKFLREKKNGFTAPEVVFYRRKLALLVWLIFAEMLFITLYTIKNFCFEYEYQEVEKSVLQMTNDEREKNLEQDECLDRLATDRAKFLYENKYFDHITPDGTTPWQFISKCGNYNYAGENLAGGYSDKKEMHGALMNSETHKKNIQYEKYKSFGFGCYENICVEFFKG